MTITTSIEDSGTATASTEATYTTSDSDFSDSSSNAPKYISLEKLVKKAKKLPGGIPIRFLRPRENTKNSSNEELREQGFNFKDYIAMGGNGAVFGKSTVTYQTPKGEIITKGITGKGFERVIKLSEARDADADMQKAMHEYQLSPPHLRVKKPQLIDINGNPYIALTMRKMPGKHLGKWLKAKLSLADRLAIAAAVINAFHEQVYQENIMHLDIKPENIMVYRDKKTGKWIANFIDFGIGASKETDRKILANGTLAFLSSEQINALSIKVNKNKKVEVKESDWDNMVVDFTALGRVVAGLISNKHPYNIYENHMKMYNAKDIKQAVKIIKEHHGDIGRANIIEAEEGLKSAIAPRDFKTSLTDVLYNTQEEEPLKRGNITDILALGSKLELLSLQENAIDKINNCFDKANEVAIIEKNRDLHAAIVRTKEAVMRETKALFHEKFNSGNNFVLNQEEAQRVNDIVKLAKMTQSTVEKVYEAPNPKAPNQQQEKMDAIQQYHEMLDTNTSISLKTKESAGACAFILFGAYTIACASLGILAVASLACPLSWGVAFGSLALIGACCVPGIIGSIAMHSRFFTSPAQDLARALPKDTMTSSQNIVVPSV